tara:strand:+ start:511 stop:843 length:333 start_codon:yes stop_codon:yes gene_type:complete
MNSTTTQPLLQSEIDDLAHEVKMRFMDDYGTGRRKGAANHNEVTGHPIHFHCGYDCRAQHTSWKAGCYFAGHFPLYESNAHDHICFENHDDCRSQCDEMTDAFNASRQAR